MIELCKCVREICDRANHDDILKIQQELYSYHRTIESERERVRLGVIERFCVIFFKGIKRKEKNVFFIQNKTKF